LLGFFTEYTRPEAGSKYARIRHVSRVFIEFVLLSLVTRYSG
jgi:hypothetical protein